jgi:hypothetical protein
MARPLSRPQPPEAVAEGQPLQGSGHRRQSAAEFGGPSLRQPLAWSLAPSCRPFPTARGRARPSRRRGYALLAWIFDGLAPDYDVRGREGDPGFGEARIRGGTIPRARNPRTTALYSVGLATRTMMHSCASAAKFLGGGTHSLPRRKGHGTVRFPPPRIVARSSEGLLAREKKLLFRKGLGKPRRLSSPAFDVPAQAPASNNTTPAGTTPSSTKRHRSISNLRAIATIIVLRTPRGPSTVRV